MPRSPRFYLLGADDPEMREMERLLRSFEDSFKCYYPGSEIVYATSGGIRVHPGNAYKADPIPNLNKGAILYRIECEPVGVPDGVSVVVIDHHRPGDPGYEKGPEDYWFASSLGQLWQCIPFFTGMENATETERCIAAMDHCFAAAIRGECPGVSAEGILALKISEIAKGVGANEAEIKQRIQHFKNLLATAPLITVNQQLVADMRSEYLGEGYSLDLLSAQVAVAISGKVSLLRHCQQKGVPETWSLSGNATPEIVDAFMKVWAPSQGLVRIYGAPTRGYAGGYVA